jgi:predicted dehydrogenase
MLSFREAAKAAPKNLAVLSLPDPSRGFGMTAVARCFGAGVALRSVFREFAPATSIPPRQAVAGWTSPEGVRATKGEPVVQHRYCGASTMTRIGIVGTGGISHAHASGFLALPDRATVTALCDVDEANLNRMAARFPEAKRFSDWKELLASDVDAVVICLPHHLHRPCIVDCAEAGKHILCEKPLCTNLDDAEQIRAALRGGVKLMCAHNQLFDPAVERARKALDDGLVGDVWALRTVDCVWLTEAMKGQWGWRGNKETMGGGCLIDTGYHPTYMLLYLANSTPKEVVGMTDKYYSPGLDGEDTAEVLVRFENGVRGSILTSWAHEVPHGYWQVHAIGNRGQLFGRRSELFVQPTGWSEPARIALPGRKAFQAQAEHFLDCIENDLRPRNDHEDGISVLQVILGAYNSVTTGKVQRYPLSR